MPPARSRADCPASRARWTSSPTERATPLVVGFIDEYRQVYGVESICRALSAHGIQIAPRTYRKARRRPPSTRDVADAHVENALRDLAGQPEEMYGRRKMTRYLRRRGHQVAFCTVDRIMRERRPGRPASAPVLPPQQQHIDLLTTRGVSAIIQRSRAG